MSCPTKLSINNIKKISAAKNHSAALNYAGDLYVWGENNYKQLGGTDRIVYEYKVVASGVSDIEVG